MKRTTALFLIASVGADPVTANDQTDARLDAAEREQQDDLQRLRAVNDGELQFLAAPAAENELQTQTLLTLAADSIDHGWVDLRQCQRGLDAMASGEIVYRYARMRGLRIEEVRNIGAAAVEEQSVQLRDIGAGAEICVAAQVNILRALGDGRYRLVSGPYHRRFLDGYFPLTLTLELRYPATALRWRNLTPSAQTGFTVTHAPGHMLISTRFTGSLTVTVEFAAVE